MTRIRLLASVSSLSSAISPPRHVAGLSLNSDLNRLLCLAQRMVQNHHFRHRKTRIDGPAEPVYTSSTVRRIQDTLITVDEASIGYLKRFLRWLTRVRELLRRLCDASMSVEAARRAAAAIRDDSAAAARHSLEGEL